MQRSASKSEPILRVSKLNVELGGESILHNLTFYVNEGETLVILGPNGAGKTVLLRALLGIVPHEGTIQWREGVRIGYVPQRVTIAKDLPLTIEDFFSLKGVSRKKAATSLALVGLQGEDILKRPAGILSAGQLQRVLIAWALTKDPNVLLFDEPTTGIDVTGEETIHAVIERMQKERKLTILLVTHDLTEVYGEASSVLCVNRNLFCHGSPEEILDPKVLRKIYGRDVHHFRRHHD